jgi:thiamine biosynthesis lipoprotein
MRQSRLIMGMPVLLEIIGNDVPQSAYDRIFDYFTGVDERFSTYKEGSEISRINRGEIIESEYSREMQEIFRLAKQTESDTRGYFSIHTPTGTIDPSGLVKGWAIQNAADSLNADGYQDFYIEIAGDIQTKGKTNEGKEWSLGIRSPFNVNEIVKVIYPRGAGVATSGNYVRGDHIYNPHGPAQPAQYVSLTVIGPNIYEADRFATAAFAMGASGMSFLESLEGFAAYSIDPYGMALMTSNFETYTQP